LLLSLPRYNIIKASERETKLKNVIDCALFDLLFANF